VFVLELLGGWSVERTAKIEFITDEIYTVVAM
jgi:hypothetical protein